MAASSATRVRDIHKRLKKHATAKTVGGAWSLTFGVPEGHPKTLDWTMDAAIAFMAEIDKTRGALEAIGVPLEAMGNVFARLRDAASPTTFPQGWESRHRDIAAPDCTAVLEWTVWALREHEEPEVSADQFGAIGVRLSELEEALATTEMPPALRAFIQKQVDEMREALRMYPIAGVSVLNKAVEVATGAFTVPSDAVAQEVKHASPQQMSVVSKALGLLKTTAEATGHVEKLAEAFKAIASYASEVGPALKAIGASIFKLP